MGPRSARYAEVIGVNTKCFLPDVVKLMQQDDPWTVQQSLLPSRPSRKAACVPFSVQCHAQWIPADLVSWQSDAMGRFEHLGEHTNEFGNVVHVTCQLGYYTQVLASNS